MGRITQRIKARKWRPSPDVKKIVRVAIGAFIVPLLCYIVVNARAPELLDFLVVVSTACLSVTFLLLLFGHYSPKTAKFMHQSLPEFVYHSMVSILYLVATFWLIANNATFGYNLAGVIGIILLMLINVRNFTYILLLFNFVLAISMTALITSSCLLLSGRPVSNTSAALFELLYHSMLSVLYLISSSFYTAKFHYPFLTELKTDEVFGVVNTLFYGCTTFMAIKMQTPSS